MTLNEVRAKYLAFFKERGHTILPSSSLVPENDPTTLFTGSGMQPLVPYLLGKNHPAGARLANSQKCFRAMDIEEVGDNRHTTFFEMLGNWSLGDYFKKDQINWFWEFLTTELGLDPQRIFVTCYIGNEGAGISKDTESASIWKDIFTAAGIDAKEIDIDTEENGYTMGEQGGRIFFYGDKNWWSRAGAPGKMPAGEPGGPDTEVFYLYPEVEHDLKWGAYCHPNCDCGRYIELGNSVFMQYLKTAEGFEKLPKQNVDYGGGLERITAAVNDSSDVFPVAHAPIIEYLEKASGKKYKPEVERQGVALTQDTTLKATPFHSTEDTVRAFRIIADHMKAAVFLIGDGVRPSNTERGYFVRRLIRRGVRYADRLGISDSGFAQIVRPVAEMYKEQYPEIGEKAEEIEFMIAGEEDKFRRTLARGMKELERFIAVPSEALAKEGGGLGAKDIFKLVTTYGFPLELIIEEAGEKGIKHIDTEGFKELLKAHQDLSRAGSAQKFAGGLADTAEKTVRLHTAHHLLLRALQIVLGPEVKQRGSNITQERLRIDFSYPQKMTVEQLAQVEKIVNEKIVEDLPVIRSEMSREEAEKLGAEHEFGAKYPERVSVYSVGPKDATEANPNFAERFSIEFCGGPHITHTGELAAEGKHFKIQKEEAISLGIRRIRAVLTN